MPKFDLKLAQELLEKGKQFVPKQAKPSGLYFYSEDDNGKTSIYNISSTAVPLDKRCACLLGQIFLGVTKGKSSEYEVITTLNNMFPNCFTEQVLTDLSFMFESGTYETKEEILVEYAAKVAE